MLKHFISIYICSCLIYNFYLKFYHQHLSVTQNYILKVYVCENYHIMWLPRILLHGKEYVLFIVISINAYSSCDQVFKNGIIIVFRHQVNIYLVHTMFYT